MRKTKNNIHLSKGRVLDFKENLHTSDPQLKKIHKSMMLLTFIEFKVKANNNNYPTIVTLNPFNAHHHFRK